LSENINITLLITLRCPNLSTVFGHIAYLMEECCTLYPQWPPLFRHSNN